MMRQTPREAGAHLRPTEHQSRAPCPRPASARSIPALRIASGAQGALPLSF
jgi:hypothetical protein